MTYFTNSQTAFINLQGAYASLPSAGIAGRTYECTDSPLTFYDNGSAWVPYYQGIECVSPPAVGNFTTVTAAGATLTTSNTLGGILLSMTTPANSNDIRLIYKSTPATPYTITARINLIATSAEYYGGGMVLRQSSNGSIIIAGALVDTALNPSFGVIARKLTANSTGSSPTFTVSGTDYLLAPINNISSFYIRMSDDGTTRTISYSFDKVNFIVISSISRTDFITPDGIGLFVAQYAAGGMTVVSTSSSSIWCPDYNG